MSGTRGGFGRLLAMGVALALALLLLAAGEARAGKYAVAQCGWYAGADADWAETTGGAKFRPETFCVPPPGADPFAGTHLSSFTRDGQGTVSGNRFGRWRWVAPGGTVITALRGSWAHALRDGMQHRIGGVDGAGGFTPVLVAAASEPALAEFAIGFPNGALAVEDRLLCARGESNWCSTEPGSWSGARALTFTLEDIRPPAAGIGGELLAGGWRRGVQSAVVWGADVGAGLRYAETILDGARVGFTEFPCAKALIGGEWRATLMRPCGSEQVATQPLATTSLSDAPHLVIACVTDFAGNRECTAAHPVLVDNNPPAHPRSPQLAGGEGWRRGNDFDLSWTNPDQGLGSPIAGAGWRVTGPGGYDSGARFAAGREIAKLSDLTVPAPGAYVLRLWLRDEAGNEAPASALTVPLRFDDRPPAVAFAGAEGGAPPAQVTAEVEDPLAGPAAGQISYRRADSERWLELPTKLAPTAAGRASLVAAVPELDPGLYLFRAEASDAAGNTATTTLRADGTRMEVRVAAPVVAPKAKTRLFARLGRAARGGGDSLTVPFAATAPLSGRLIAADGEALAGRLLRVVSRPSRGALVTATRTAVRTGERGGFELSLPPGPSRQVSVVFAGEDGLEPARRSSLDLRVRSGVSLEATPTALATGETVTLSGRVEDRAAPIPRRGKLVAIQYREEETGRWRPVLVIRSDHDGRFQTRYRFRYVSGSAAIRLRATALAEERWPYAPGSSPPVTVRVGG
ncbi:MAG TPA: hypothetical protein VFJ57_08475 [Solirubrobacterales bacterium]|nr:hypothetical protein [Solirubrobacterales bacterium]